jgi:hypothetical protein
MDCFGVILAANKCQIAYELFRLNNISFMVRIHFVQLVLKMAFFKDTGYDGSPPCQCTYLDREEFHRDVVMAP